MEKTGITIDTVTLNQIAEDTLAQMNEVSMRIMSYVDEPFNLNSPKQLAVVLFDKLNLPANKKRSTSVEVLEKLQGKHPIIDDLMIYRKVAKQYSTYAEGLKKYIQADGRIHTEFNQCVTQTGRLSSTNPNLQNISVRDEQSRQIRKAFVPSENHVLMACDYSQVELRVLAHIADEKGLIDAFVAGMDIHTKTAMDLFKVEASEVTSLMRRAAKAVNFGIVYGISDFGLAQQIDVSRKEAQEFIDRYFESYPNILTYTHSTIEECTEKGYVTTLYGRRREIPEIFDKNYMVREFGKRAATNARIQGTAADLIKLAMIKIDQRMKKEGVKSKMLLQVHDELIFDVVNGEEDLMKNIIEEEMTHAMELKVPLVAECKAGNSWYQVK
jgi:DNA polymerase-1